MVRAWHCAILSLLPFEFTAHLGQVFREIYNVEFLPLNIGKLVLCLCLGQGTLPFTCYT